LSEAKTFVLELELEFELDLDFSGTQIG